MSTRRSADITPVELRVLSSIVWLTNSETTQSTPRLSIIPMNGGRCVQALKIGTTINPASPNTRNSVRCHGWIVLSSLSSVLSEMAGKSPFIQRDAIKSGMSKQTTLGRNNSRITSTELILFFTQSMVVVTSPITLHAPPAFAAMTAIPTNINRVSRSATNLRNSDTATIAVVRLSNTEDKKKVTQPTIHSRVT